MKDSSYNRFAFASVGGGSTPPIWKFREWLWSGDISIYRLDPQTGEIIGGFGFDFPEGKLIDSLAHGIANIVDAILHSYHIYKK